MPQEPSIFQRIKPYIESFISSRLRRAKRSSSTPPNQPIHIQLGARAEKKAQQYLHRQGLHLIAKNYRTRLGEIDLIMRDKNTVVFIEVRHRNTVTAAKNSVSYHKKHRIIKTADVFLQHHHEHATLDTRFDVIATDGQRIDWITDAFTVE